MNLKGNIEELSCDSCCRLKSLRTTYSECFFCSLRYPACNANGPYCTCRISRYTVIFHIIYIPYDFRKMFLNIKYNFRFLYNVFQKLFTSLDGTDRDTMENLCLSSCKRTLFYSNLKEIEFSGQNFDKYINITLNDNTSCIRDFLCEQT